MIYGLYLSAQGADAAAFQQSVWANNLANAQTTGFKRDIPIFRAHSPFDVENLQPPAAPDTIDNQTGGLSVEGTVTDFNQGSLKTTGSDFDLAITSLRPAFLEVGDGKQRWLTRNGQLSMNQDNVLTMSTTGLPVLSIDGEVFEVPENSSRLDISSEGIVTSLDGNNLRAVLGQLSLVEPTSPELLLKEGESLYVNLGKALPAEDAQLKQGMLEEADVSPVTGMLNLIQASRGFEMNMNLVKLQDDLLGRLLQSAAKK